MPKNIEIPGVGVVEFPDSMSEADVNAAAAKLYQESQGGAKPERTWGDTARDLAGGVRAGVANTVYGGGDLIRRAIGAERIIDRPEVKAEMTPPDSTAGRIGFGAEQIGEFLLPTGVVGKLKKGVEVAKAGILTLSQTGGDPAAAGISAGLTAVLPGAGAVSKASGALESSAQKTMAQALGATKEWAKVEAGKLAPEMLKRGVGGSRESMLTLAQETSKRVGNELDAAYAAAAQAGETVPGDIVRGYLQIAADRLTTTTAAGSRMPIPGTERVVRRLERLEQFVGSLGPDIPIDRAVKLKRTWDHIVSKAGLYGPKATASATDSADAWAFREASSSIRAFLNTNPTIEALNKEVGFWTGLKKVLAETEKRTQTQASTGLVAAGTGGAGAIVGAMTGGESLSDKAQGAILGGIAGRQVVKLLQSPAWRTQVSGQSKQLLADALASGHTAKVTTAVNRIVSSLPAQLRPAFAP